MMRVLITDDEPLALEVLEHYLQRIPDIELVGKCSNAMEAFSALNRLSPDLILLDINMPELNGIDFVQSLKSPPMIIFTTAYTDYAVKSYELHAIDYLVKPIPFERFLAAIRKALDHYTQRNAAITINAAPPVQAASPGLLFVRAEGKLVRLDLATLWLVEGLRDYLRLWTDVGPLVVHCTMKQMEEQLQSLSLFQRVSKSAIVNMQYVREVEGNTIRIRDQRITIGPTYRDAVAAFLDRYRLLP